MLDDKMNELIDRIDLQIAELCSAYELPVDYFSAVLLARLMVANEYAETLDRFKHTMNTALTYSHNTPDEPLH